MNDAGFTEQELAELKESFFVEAFELLDAMNQDVLDLETGQDQGVSLQNIQRYLHTLKGNSRALGFMRLNTLAHKYEDLIKIVQDRNILPTPELVDMLLMMHDSLLQLVQANRNNGDALPDIAQLARIEAAMRSMGAPAPEPAGNAAEDPGKSDGNDALSPQTGQKSAAAVGDVTQMLKVDARRVDKILNLMGELVIGRSLIGQVLADLTVRYPKDPHIKKLGDANQFMEKTISQLQKDVMKIRMLPIHRVFRKFPRVVRDLSREKGKEAVLELVGGKTEIDKSILDVIGEPLIHLIRNAIDHGIEPPEERERLGKARRGTIVLKAAHEGNQIVVSVEDDGAGIDPDRIRTKALAKNLKTREELARISDDDLMELIFVPGFSTVDQVTDVSGRGLGMDIVKATVEKLKGKIDVRSRRGAGTTFILRLPLTLSIIKGMLFYAGNRLLALPLSSVEKIVRLRDNNPQTINNRRVLRYREKVIRLFTLRETLMLNDDAAETTGNRFVIITGLGEKMYGFVVDRIVGQQELVIKILDNYWDTLECTSGASIMGNGKVVLILDAAAVIAKERLNDAAA